MGDIGGMLEKFDDLGCGNQRNKSQINLTHKNKTTLIFGIAFFRYSFIRIKHT